MSELVQITQIPPLRQSTEETMACPRFYTEVFIKGRKAPSGMDAARGTEVHKAMSLYLSYCARKSVSTDMEAFERFSRGAGPQAHKILMGLRDGYIVDHEHLFSTELSMALDDDMNPTDIAEELSGIVTDSELPAAHQGTLDGLYAFRSEKHILIDDFKSHMRPFDPDDKPQGKKYALFVFQHFAWVEKVTFRLTFVRYKNVSRTAVYTRDQAPMLIDAVRAARARQKMLHEDYDAGKDIPAIAGTQCTYCPLLPDASCPIAEFNPAMQLPMEQRLNFALWYSQFSRLNNATLKAHVDGTGRPVTLKDYNGKSYVFGPVETESEVYPLFEGTEISISTECMGCGILLPYVPEGGKCPACASGQVKLKMPIVNLLESAAFANPRDTDWMGKLLISSTELKSKLKTKKRVHLDQAVHDTADKVTKVSLRISKPLDAVPEEDEDDEDIMP